MLRIAPTIALAVALAAGGFGEPAPEGPGPRPPEPSPFVDNFVRALELFATNDFKAARPLFEAMAAEPGGFDEAHLYLALIAFFYAEDDAAAKHLARVQTPSYIRKALEGCLEGPFRARLGEAAFLAEGRTAHYHLATDIACDPALVQAAEAELKKLGADPVKNAKRIEKLKAKRSRGFEELGSLLERIYAEYSGMFKFEKDEKLVSRVYIFDRREDFAAFSARIGHEDAGENAAGWYWSPLRILVIDAADVGASRGVLQERGMHTVFHEAFHQFLDYYVDDAPIWFNEGIAEYFGPSIPVPGTKKVMVGVVKKTYEDGERMTRYEVLMEALKPGARIAPTPLRRLVALDRESFMQRDRVNLHYAQAWSFIHYLANRHPKGRRMIVDYFNALRRGEDQKAAHEAAFKDVDWDRLEADWKAYAERL